MVRTVQCLNALRTVLLHDLISVIVDIAGRLIQDLAGTAREQDRATNQCSSSDPFLCPGKGPVHSAENLP